MKKLGILLALLTLSVITFGQSNGIFKNLKVKEKTFLQETSVGASAVDGSSILDIVSTTKGLLIPRLTTVQRDLIGSPAIGLFIYNLTVLEFNVYDGVSWVSVGGGVSGLPANLAVDNTTGGNDITISNGDAIKSASGGVTINPRAYGTDGYLLIENDPTYAKSWFELAATWADIGFGNRQVVLDNSVGIQLTTNYNNNTDLSRLTLLDGSMFFQVVDQSTGRTGLIGLENNTAGNVTIDNTVNIPAYVAAQNATINHNVINTAVIGGVNSVLKTNNAAYSNNFIFNTGEAFETKLNYTTPTHENTITFPDTTGTAALLLNTFYAADGTFTGNRVSTLGVNTLTFSSTASPNRMVLNNGGVGIDKVPSSALDVNGETRSTTATIAGVITSNAASDQTLYYGKVGSSNRFEILSSGGTGLRLYNSDGSTIGVNLLSGVASASWMGLAGNVGIGTSTPTAKLNTKGAGSTNSTTTALFENLAGTDILIIKDGGSVGIGTSTPNANALLDMTSTTQGVLFPRMTATQGSAITGVDGLVIYVTNTNGTFTSVGFWGYEASAWVKL